MYANCRDGFSTDQKKKEFLLIKNRAFYNVILRVTDRYSACDDILW